MIEDYTRHLGVLTLALHFPMAQSLKEKRMILKSFKGRLLSRFEISLAEVAGMDKWQVATLAIAMISSDQKIVDSTFQNILSFAAAFDNLELCEHEINYY